MKWQLVVGRGRRKGQVIPLARMPFSIGRGEGCHLRPAASGVSRRHCELFTQAGRLIAVDHRSTNGTFVNGRRVAEEQELRRGDRLRVGPLEFLIDLDLTAPPPARRPLDEDAIGEMLLAMDEEESATSDSKDSAVAPGAPAVTENGFLTTQDKERRLRT